MRLTKLADNILCSGPPDHTRESMDVIEEIGRCIESLKNQKRRFSVWLIGYYSSATCNDVRDRDTGQLIMDGGVSLDDTIIANRREKLNLITQVTRAKLIQNVLGHKWMMPSKRELDYYNPSKSSGTISEHLDKLIDAGILVRVIVPQGQRERDLPNTFFTLSSEGYSLLSSHSLFLPNCDEIREDHNKVDKTEEIKRYEQARRPTVDVGYSHPLQGDGISVVDPTEYATELSCNIDKDDPDPHDREHNCGQPTNSDGILI